MVGTIELNSRQQKILEIVKKHGPITGEKIAEKLNVTRATLRPDLSILTMAGFLDARPRVGYFYTGKPVMKLIRENLRKLKVKDFQSIPVVVASGVSAYDANCARCFSKMWAHCLLSTKIGLLLGVISRKDLLRASLGKQDLHPFRLTLS